MKSFALFFAALSSLPALASQAFVCNSTDALGAPTYLVLVEKMAPGSGSGAVILKRNLHPEAKWEVVYGDATANRVPDGGPLVVNGTSDDSKIDWQALGGRCFVSVASLSFSLYERTDGTKGTVTYSRRLALNPNRVEPCPDPFPEVPATNSISCTDY